MRSDEKGATAPFSSERKEILEIRGKIADYHLPDILEELFHRKKYAIMSICPYEIMGISGGGCFVAVINNIPL
jgi:hypothetical protein